MEKLLQNSHTMKMLSLLLMIGIFNLPAFAGSHNSKITNDCAAATLILPDLPTNLSCVDGANYDSAPDAYYDNYQTGECENNGSISATIVKTGFPCEYPIITITYEGSDDFGNPLYATHYIEVDYAPNPTLSIPEFPDTISIEEAIDFQVPIITYDNGVTGVCRMIDTVRSAIVWDDWDYCNGGYISINYDIQDDCMHVFHLGYGVIVAPPPPAVFTIPEFPSSITCEEAMNYVAPPITFTNGVTGPAENSGIIEGQVYKYLDSWGYVEVNYSGSDNCGNEFSYYTSMYIEDWYPDFNIPIPPDTLTVTQALNFNPPPVTYSNGLLGDCAIEGVIPAYVSHYWENPCIGGILEVGYVDYPLWMNDLFWKYWYVQVVPDADCAADEFCTLTQGSYGNAGGNFCNGESQREVMDALLQANGGMIVGDPQDGRSFTIPANGGQCIEDILPGGGPSTALSGNYGCGNFGNLLKNGRLKNSLLAQTITLQLNLWLSPTLGNMVLESRDFITLGSTGCGNGPNTPMEDTMTFSIPSSVYSNLTAKNVYELFGLANQALGTSPWPSDKPSLSSISDALSTINEAFDECRFIQFIDGYKSSPVIASKTPDNINLNIAPNPFTGSTQISFGVNSASKVIVEIYDLQGRLITKIFEGDLQDNETKQIQYQASELASQSPQICIIRTNNAVKHQIMLNMR